MKTILASTSLFVSICALLAAIYTTGCSSDFDDKVDALTGNGSDVSTTPPRTKPITSDGDDTPITPILIKSMVIMIVGQMATGPPGDFQSA